MATSDSFEFKREPRTASEEGGIQDSSDLSVWGNLKAGWNQGWNQDADAQSPSTISDAMSEAGSSTYSKADQDRSETIASKQSQLLRSKGLGTRFGEWERIGKDLKYYLRKPVLVRGEFTEKADKMLQEGRVGDSALYDGSVIADVWHAICSAQRLLETWYVCA